MSSTGKSGVVEFIEAMVLAFFLAMFIRTFIVQAYTIPSGSMLETLQIGDYLLVNKFHYGVKVPFTNNYLWERGNPEHGDIIVFEFPDDPSVDYIKRVIGVPGDTLEMRDKVLYRNGERLDEPYVEHKDTHIIPSRDSFAPITVPEDHFFCLGDNRDYSRDSRFWRNTFVEKSAIHGNAVILYWSMEGFGNVRWSRIGNLVK